MTEPVKSGEPIWWLVNFIVFHPEKPYFPMSLVVDTHPFVWEKEVNRQLAESRAYVRNISLQGFQQLSQLDMEKAKEASEYPATYEVVSLLRAIR